MDVSNLARVFGPTIVGHAVANPDPMTILQDTKRQPKVGLTHTHWTLDTMFVPVSANNTVPELRLCQK